STDSRSSCNTPYFFFFVCIKILYVDVLNFYASFVGNNIFIVLCHPDGFRMKNGSQFDIRFGEGQFRNLALVAIFMGNFGFRQSDVGIISYEFLYIKSSLSLSFGAFVFRVKCERPIFTRI
ncbi:hypothetical protein, partial [Bartonella sp. AC134YNZD]|uniref:hypothetical protein n=1 Tax=Bartonella sp. AC134YNZD TaxID=3243446 RepID=UPI0035CF5638